jgi:DNA-binding winged helix-turn-helix (wHTH) protein/tetratricopeptide (TPR) repeat protein
MDGDFRIGPWTIEPKLNTISGGGRTLRLEPKVMQVLVLLAQHSHELVTKKQLMSAVWPDTFVTEDVLTRAISELRKAFGDDSRQSRVIQTIPKSGYRLIAPLERIQRIAAKGSLLVLPFVSSGSDPSLKYLADGITDCIIRTLAQLPHLRVAARSTSHRYRDRGINPEAAGREVNVAAVLTGQIVQRGDALTFLVELVDVAQGSLLWAERYVHKLADLPAIEDELAARISETLSVTLTGEQHKKIAKRFPENSEAYQSYLKGRYLWHKATERSVTQAVRYFEQAIAKDRKYALAYCGVADCHYFLSCQIDCGTSLPNDAYPRAEEAVRRALELDDSLAEAHASLASIRKNFYWDWTGAEAEFRRAISLNPNYPKAHQSFADLLGVLGRFDEAIEEIKCAHELDPFSASINTDVGFLHYLARDYQCALGRFQLTLELFPNHVPAHCLIALVYEHLGMQQEADTEFKRARALCRGRYVPLAAIARMLSGGARTEQFERGLEELRSLSRKRYVPAAYFAALYVRMKRKSDAFEWIGKAADERSNWLIYLNVEPLFDFLRSDKRFESALRRVGFPTLRDAPVLAKSVTPARDGRLTAISNQD